MISHIATVADKGRRASVSKRWSTVRDHTLGLVGSGVRQVNRHVYPGPAIAKLLQYQTICQGVRTADCTSDRFAKSFPDTLDQACEQPDRRHFTLRSSLSWSNLSFPCGHARRGLLSSANQVERLLFGIDHRSGVITVAEPSRDRAQILARHGSGLGERMAQPVRRCLAQLGTPPGFTD